MVNETNSEAEHQNAQAPVAQSESDESLADVKKQDSEREQLKVDENVGQIKYTKESETKNGESAVEIGTVQPMFAGMSKEELMKYANDPFWVRLRWFLFILFWLGWLGMLAAAVVIIVLAPKCPPPPPLENWQKNPLYQVYPLSLQDGFNSDGKGDIQGIISHLDHLGKLGVKTVWLSPIFTSPMKDFGYDISNFLDIDPIFGNIEDFKALVKAMKDKDIKLVLDMVPNHSSNKHEWFIKSEENDTQYSDYYIWHDGTKEDPPNNWLSVFGGSAWTWSDKRKQWYFHQFLPEQPDLNFRNPKVHDEWNNIVRFWLEMGVSGFRIDAIPHLYEDPKFKDEPKSNNSDAKPGEYGYLNHIYTWNLPEHYDFVAEIRSVLNEYEDKDGEHRILLTESYVPLPSLIKYYGNETNRIADFPFNFALTNQIKSGFTGVELYNTISEYLNAVPDWAWPNWVIGNHDTSRAASRLGVDLVDAMAMVQLLLPGTPVIYYGEEIGMKDTFIGSENQQDPQGRDPQRTPMQWNDTENAGFSSTKPWLPVNENYLSVNVKKQEEDEESHLKVYYDLVKLREQNSILYGNISFPYYTSSIFSFIRVRKGSPGYLVAINVGGDAEIVDFSNTTVIPSEAEVVVKSVGSPHKKKEKVKTDALSLEPKQGLVLSFIPKLD